MSYHNTVVGIAVLTVLMLAGCKKTPLPDSLCSDEPLPSTAAVPSGQGAIEVLASTDTYFYVFDGAGKQLGSHAVNGVLAVNPGDYRVKVNNSVHAVTAQAATLRKCQTGAVLVSGKTDEYYYILDGAGTQLASAHLGASLSLFPASYRIRLNNADATADVAAGSTTELRTGTVNVQADTDEYYYVFDSGAKQLASGHVGRATSLFAGTYTLKVNNTQAQGDVRAGEELSIPTGTLVVRGSTDEYYYVFDTAGTQLASAHLERPLALFPGSYSVKVNNTKAPATVAAATATEINTGSLVLQGTTDEYYYVFDTAGNQLASAHLARSVSLVPGEYLAKVNGAPVPVRVEAGRVSDYPLGTLTISSARSESYYVFDQRGTQLASKPLNQPLSLPAGKYSVKVGNDSRSVVLMGGQPLAVRW